MDSDFGNDGLSDNEDEDDEMISFDSHDDEENENLSDQDDEDARIRKLDKKQAKKGEKGDPDDKNKISKDLISLNSDMDNKTDDDEKIEYYNEYVLKPVPTCIGYFNYILYLPVNLLCYVIFRDFHVVEK